MARLFSGEGVFRRGRLVREEGVGVQGVCAEGLGVRICLDVMASA